MREKTSWTKKQKYIFLSLFPVYFIIVGLLLQPLGEIGAGLVRIIKEPDFLITDYFLVGGPGAALINGGILALLCIGILYCLGKDMSGHTVTSVCLMFGFSLFGKNLLNIWTIMLGVFLYAKYHRTSLSQYIYVAFYGTCLSPIITQLMHIGHLPVAGRLLLSLLTGAAIGFVLPPLSTHIHDAHKGYSLYNVGFAAGIIATVVVSLFKSFGVAVESRLIWSEGNNRPFVLVLCLLFSGMIFIAFAHRGRKAWEGYLNILKSYGVSGTDFEKEDGSAATLLNMGVNGIFSTLLVVVLGGDLNGPTIGGIFTIVGFGATGKHIRNIFPIMLGVCLGGVTKQWKIDDPGPILALLFSTTLAPIAGEFGVIMGILAGFLHSSVALNVGILYGGMNLYNNGFAGGLLAAFMVPVIQSVRDRIARAREGTSL